MDVYDLISAPRGTLKNLALDDAIVVARPILERSPRLGEGELIEVALQQGQDHLLAISRRSSLTKNVTDILVERGDEKVVHSVAGNVEARFSQHGFDRLMVKASSDGELQDLLKARQDLPDKTMAALVELAREHVRTKLQAEMGKNAGDLVAAAVAHDFGARPARSEHGPDGPGTRGLEDRPRGRRRDRRGEDRGLDPGGTRGGRTRRLGAAGRHSLGHGRQGLSRARIRPAAVHRPLAWVRLDRVQAPPDEKGGPAAAL
jgi:Uncharacterised protein conserved in bacteria (DUF2336)